MYIAHTGLNFVSRFSTFFYVPQVCSVVVFKKPETERIMDNNDDKKDDGENYGADGIEEEDLPPGAFPELREGRPVELQDGSTKVELREGSRVELRGESPTVELREGSRLELREERSRVELQEGSQLPLQEESPRVELREGSLAELQEESTRLELRQEGSPTIEDFSRNENTPPPIDSQLTLKLAPEKYTTSADGKFKIPPRQQLLQRFLKKVTIV